MVINKYEHALLVRLVFISSLMNIKEVDKQIPETDFNPLRVSADTNKFTTKNRNRKTQHPHSGSL